AEVIVLGEKCRNIGWVRPAEKRKQVPQIVQIDAVDEDVRIALLQTGDSLSILCRNTKVGTRRNGLAVDDHYVHPQYLRRIRERDRHRISARLEIRDGVRTVRGRDEFRTWILVFSSDCDGRSCNRSALSIQHSTLDSPIEGRCRRERGNKSREQKDELHERVPPVASSLWNSEVDITPIRQQMSVGRHTGRALFELRIFCHVPVC